MWEDWPDVTILSGMARGVDSIAIEFASFAKYKVETFPPDWEKYGKVAGFMRNDEMAKRADALIAFWDGSSKGTKHMIDTAIKRGLWVKVFQK